MIHFGTSPEVIEASESVGLKVLAVTTNKIDGFKSLI